MRAYSKDLRARIVTAVEEGLDKIETIELVFAKLKAFLRKVGTTHVADLITAIAAAIATVSPQEVQRCFDHCGYVGL